MPRFYCSCFDDESEAGFDAEASVIGKISVKIGSDGQLLYINEGGYDCVDVGEIDLGTVTCGCCGDLISPEEGIHEIQ